MRKRTQDFATGMPLVWEGRSKTVQWLAADNDCMVHCIYIRDMNDKIIHSLYNSTIYCFILIMHEMKTTANYSHAHARCVICLHNNHITSHTRIWWKTIIIIVFHHIRVCAHYIMYIFWHGYIIMQNMYIVDMHSLLVRSIQNVSI